MRLYYTIVSFIFGAVLGSFYNVVAYRLPKEQSLIHPSSHCPNCNHKLGPSELIPIFSFLFQKGKCKNCHQKISWFYTIFEFLTGLLFMFCYLRFSTSSLLWINLIFISALVIVIISDYQSMIIPDEVLIFAIIAIEILLFIFFGYKKVLSSIISGAVAFLFMFLLKKLGDFIFKKESMGGGDIKLMFLFGIVLGWQQAILCVFVGSIIGLPISLFVMKTNKSHEIPFGPFLSSAALIFMFLNMSFTSMLNLFI